MTATHNLNRLCFLDLRMPILNKSNILFCVYKSVVYPAQAEFSYFSLDFRMKISLKIFFNNLEFIGVSITSVLAV